MLNFVNWKSLKMGGGYKWCIETCCILKNNITVIDDFVYLWQSSHSDLTLYNFVPDTPNFVQFWKKSRNVVETCRNRYANNQSAVQSHSPLVPKKKKRLNLYNLVQCCRNMYNFVPIQPRFVHSFVRVMLNFICFWTSHIFFMHFKRSVHMYL